MRYVVSGLPRSGTSMLMECLVAGGIPGWYDPTEDERRNAEVPGYAPNPGGFYEITPERVPLVPEHHCVKVMLPELYLLPIAAYRVIVMQRNALEQAMSREAIGLEPLCTPVPRVRELLGRGDCWVTFLQYAAVVVDPLRVFEALRADGWPLDAARAAAAVRPDLYRHRVG